MEPVLQKKLIPGIMKRTVEEDLFGGKAEQPINQKQKGNRNELMVTKLLTEWTGHEFTRIPQSGGLRWQNTANICGDVISADPSFTFPYSVETKALKSIGFRYEEALERPITLRVNSVIYSIFAQAELDAYRSNKRPMLLIRHNEMPAREYFLFLRAYDGMEQQLFDLNLKKITAFNDEQMLRGYLFSDVYKIPYKYFQ